MEHKFTIEYEGVNGKREFANTDELLVNGDNIEHMIVVPKGATNGDMIKAILPNVKYYATCVEVKLKYHGQYDTGLLFDKDFWNAPYEVNND